MTQANLAMKPKLCNCYVMLQNTRSRETSNGFDNTVESIMPWRSDDKGGCLVAGR
ncbi:MAG TPA: hypothetical protein VJ440_01195 [Candidatus Brocadiaceae bacterium]|nr:hypothetical protein [Candidatus Brocadiaceae bacterium]